MNGLSDVRVAPHGQVLDKSGSRETKANTQPNMSRWALYCHRLASRRALMRLTDDQLRDIGLNADQAMAEAMKPFWKL
ncbi:DUF1127 domain-containing protein [Pseudomonas sp. NPDC089734]|uniref:DUF1127 domain-containing protein n=1 Tax=Pseudomonas sp. NPDC089734 TaxID=3364469 RepID=UPI0037F7E26F